MCRIGVLTTHRANNFGAVLQAYSLVKACQELGTCAEIIDWRCPFYDWQYHKAVRLTRNPIVVMRHFFWHVFKETKARALFNSFRERMPLSAPIFSRRKLEETNSTYDRFIVGSDQVWNPLNSALRPEQFDRAFLLDFVDGKSRNAYAASIGVKSIEPKAIRAEFIEAWKGFDKISMREYEGADYVSGLLGTRIDTVLDPVLLHDKEWWSHLVSRKGSELQPHVFEYNVRGVAGLDEFASKIARSQNTFVVNPLIPSFSHRRCDQCKTMGPADFVTEIADASCVVTSSFHAAAFSVIFGKKLYVIRRKNSRDPNSRFSSLFRFARLEEEVVSETDQHYIALIDCEKASQEGLSRARGASIEILRQICLG